MHAASNCFFILSRIKKFTSQFQSNSKGYNSQAEPNSGR
jgi:hypothetical protein